MKAPDVVQARVPGAMLALFAFMLTVLLGIGGTAAVALWQQSATATMSVSAAANWGPPTITLACTPSTNEKTATLSVSSTQTPTLLSIARQINGTYSPLAIEYLADLNAQTFTLTETSPIVIANAGANPMTVRVTATFSDGQKATTEWTLGIVSSGGKVKCAP
ncbi:hypothetical protein [uncultured Arthrobacter sp.]|uniref:hypothetical protein n=1 Tax=uncultured Arthrobacter sp. TaxID=114050 RepID=UPI0028D4625F|nr:hypothetical protein [uncultured Arthrobacter sp.]